MKEKSADPVQVHEVYAYLCVDDTAAAIAFYRRAFGAEELFRLTEPGGRIGHAEIRIGPATVMLADEFPEYGFRSARSIGATAVVIHLHVDRVDDLWAQAIAAGAEVVTPVADRFYGERGGRLRDPFGHEWLLGQQIEAVSPEEMQRRYDALFSNAKT